MLEKGQQEAAILRAHSVTKTETGGIRTEHRGSHHHPSSALRRLVVEDLAGIASSEETSR